jgi:hypothetical protein
MDEEIEVERVRFFEIVRASGAALVLEPRVGAPADHMTAPLKLL